MILIFGTLTVFPLVLIYLMAWALIEAINQGVGETRNPLCVDISLNEVKGNTYYTTKTK